jgi:Ni/Co efflux regulator RcnB
MTQNPTLRGLLLAAAAAVAVAALAQPASAGPKATPPGAAKGGHVPPAYGTHCPPGLAKKGSCIPPGHRKHWKAGEYIPRDVAYRRVRYGDYDLPRPQPGYIYADVGGDIYLLAEATRRVIEAVILVDAASR